VVVVVVVVVVEVVVVGGVVVVVVAGAGPFGDQIGTVPGARARRFVALTP
jgi:hypothetical protein